MLLVVRCWNREVSVACAVGKLEEQKLNQQVKRNITRFPEDFMFQLNKEEIPESFRLKSQIVTLNEKGDKGRMMCKADVTEF